MFCCLFYYWGCFLKDFWRYLLSNLSCVRPSIFNTFLPLPYTPYKYLFIYVYIYIALKYIQENVHTNTKYIFSPKFTAVSSFKPPTLMLTPMLHERK